MNEGLKAAAQALSVLALAAGVGWLAQPEARRNHPTPVVTPGPSRHTFPPSPLAEFQAFRWLRLNLEQNINPQNDPDFWLTLTSLPQMDTPPALGFMAQLGQVEQSRLGFLQLSYGSEDRNCIPAATAEADLPKTLSGQTFFVGTRLESCFYDHGSQYLNGFTETFKLVVDQEGIFQPRSQAVPAKIRPENLAPVAERVFRDSSFMDFNFLSTSADYKAPTLDYIQDYRQDEDTFTTRTLDTFGEVTISIHHRR